MRKGVGGGPRRRRRRRRNRPCGQNRPERDAKVAMGEQRTVSSQLDVDIVICSACGNRICLEFASEVVVLYSIVFLVT